MPPTTPGLRRVIYLSRVERPDPRRSEDETVADILAASRCNNRRLGLTGALVHGAGHFAQLLEGPAEVVGRVLDVIARDPRHSAMQVVETTAAPSRAFANWNMAYLQDLDLIPAEFAADNASLALLLRLRALLNQGAALEAA
jgi:hypothetical protein